MHDQIGEAPPTEHTALQQGFYFLHTSITKLYKKKKKKTQGRRKLNRVVEPAAQ